jgi:hypothetical protein
MFCFKSFSEIILKFGFSCESRSFKLYYLETIPFIILIITLIEVAIRKPIKSDAISYVICIAASVNLSIGPSVLSYSMLLTLVPAAIIFVPTSVSADARPLPPAILKVSLVDFSVY